MRSNFTRKELECPCCKQMYLADGFLDALDALRSDVGEPMVITSAYRCAKHNKAVNGAENSQHMKGCAVDIQCTGRRAWLIVSKAAKHGFFGIGVKPGMLHIDRRPEPTKSVFGYS